MTGSGGLPLADGWAPNGLETSITRFSSSAKLIAYEHRALTMDWRGRDPLCPPPGPMWVFTGGGYPVGSLLMEALVP